MAEIFQTIEGIFKINISMLLIIEKKEICSLADSGHPQTSLFPQWHSPSPVAYAGAAPIHTFEQPQWDLQPEHGSPHCTR